MSTKITDSPSYSNMNGNGTMAAKGAFTFCSGKSILKNELQINNMSEKPKCPHCWGSGWETQFIKPCTYCKGTGEVLKMKTVEDFVETFIADKTKLSRLKEIDDKIEELSNDRDHSNDEEMNDLLAEELEMSVGIYREAIIGYLRSIDPPPIEIEITV